MQIRTVRVQAIPLASQGPSSHLRHCGRVSHPEPPSLSGTEGPAPPTTNTSFRSTAGVASGPPHLRGPTPPQPPRYGAFQKHCARRHVCLSSGLVCFIPLFLPLSLSSPMFPWLPAYLPLSASRDSFLFFPCKPLSPDLSCHNVTLCHGRPKVYPVAFLSCQGCASSNSNELD